MNLLSKIFPLPSLNVSKGIMWMVVSIFLFSINDALYKYASLHIPPERTILWRSFISILLLGLYGISKERQTLWQVKRGTFYLHITRGILAFGSFLIMGYALKSLKIASFMGVYYACPLTLTVFSVLFLKEKITRNGIKKIILGFSGVLIIFTPGSDVFSFHGLLALFSMLLFASSVIVAKKMTREPHLRLLFYYVSLCFVFSLFIEFPHFEWPSLMMLLQVGIMSPIHLAAFTCFNQAMRTEEVQKVAPFEYTGLIWTMLLGFVVFSEIPETSTLVGATLIILSALLFNKKSSF